VGEIGRDVITADGVLGEEAHQEALRKSLYTCLTKRDELIKMQRKRTG